MIPSTLKAVCAAYHKKTAADLTVNSVDLFLVALNNVRHSAEQRHNFEHSRCVATIDIDGVEGADISDAEITGSVGDTCTVTGSLTPNATGTYNYVGVKINGRNFFVRSTGTYGLAWTISDNYWNIYTLNNSPEFVTQIDGWIFQSTSLNPAGTYAANNTTGTATVANSGTASFSGLKEIIAVSRQRPDGTYIPLDFARADIPIERDRTELEFEDSLFPYVRYPSDADIRTGGSSSSIVQRGSKLEIYPHFNDDTATPLSCRLEAIGWLPDYTASSLLVSTAPDYFFEHGAQYLQWAVIIELNQYFKTFVPRQEGNLGEPATKMADAWRDFLIWDSYMVDSNTTRSR